MSDLPNGRLSVGEKLFSKVREDYFGPLVVKLSNVLKVIKQLPKDMEFC